MNQQVKGRQQLEKLTAIAKEHALKISGISGLSKKGVTLSKEKSGTWCVDVYVNTVMGCSIPEAAFLLQKELKTALENDAGISVSKVNIHITGTDYTRSNLK